MSEQGFKYLIFVFMIAIVYALGSGLYYLLAAKKTAKSVKALTVRIGLSLLLFFALFVAMLMGWITPHGIIPQ